MANLEVQSHVCLGSDISWLSRAKSTSPDPDQHIKDTGLCYPDGDNENSFPTRVFYDRLHEEVILIRGSPPTEFFVSDKPSGSWKRYLLQLPDNPTIQDANLSFDRTYISQRTNDKDVRFYDTSSGVMVESRSCQGSDASMFSLQWIHSRPGLFSQSDPQSEIYEPILEGAVDQHEFNPQQDAQDMIMQPVSVAGVPPTVQGNEQLKSDTPASVQQLIFVTSVGLEQHAMSQNELRRLKTVAVNIIDQWPLPNRNLSVVLSTDHVFHMFSVNVESGMLARVCKFELDYSSNTAATVPDKDTSSRALVHSANTQHGEFGFNANFSGGLVSGNGNTALGNSASTLKYTFRLHIVTLYSRVYCALVNETTSQQFLLSFVNGTMTQMCSFDLLFSGRSVVFALDHLVCVYNIQQSIITLYDILTPRASPICAPVALGFKNKPTKVFHTWLCYQPNCIVNVNEDGSEGIVYTLSIDYAMLCKHWVPTKIGRLAELLLHRFAPEAKLLFLNILRELLSKGHIGEHSSTDTASLGLFSKLFGSIAKNHSNAVICCKKYSTVLPSLQASLESSGVPTPVLTQTGTQNDESPVTTDTQDTYRALLSSCHLQELFGHAYTSVLYHAYTREEAVVTQYDLAYHVFLPVLAASHKCTSQNVFVMPPPGLFSVSAKSIVGCMCPTHPPARLEPILLELQRTLHRHKITVEPVLQHIVASLLIQKNALITLSRYLQEQVLANSDYITDCVLAMSLTTDRPDAHVAEQIQLSNLYRKGDGARILRFYILKGDVLGGQRLVSFKSGLLHLPGLKPKDFLHRAVLSNDTQLFYNTMKYFESRNVTLRGTVQFAMEEDCDNYVQLYRALFPHATGSSYHNTNNSISNSNHTTTTTTNIQQ